MKLPEAERSLGAVTLRLGDLSVNERAQVRLGARLDVELGWASMKGRVKAGVGLKGTPKGLLSASVMPTKVPVVAAGAVAALAAGKSLSTSPSASIIPGVGLEAGLSVAREGRQLTLALEHSDVLLRL